MPATYHASGPRKDSRWRRCKLILIKKQNPYREHDARVRLGNIVSEAEEPARFSRVELWYNLQARVPAVLTLKTVDAVSHLPRAANG
jgi:hypothetical protein